MTIEPTFYDEFRRQGQLLVPERPVLLALVRLYSWLTTYGVEVVPEGKLREFLAQGEADALAGEPASVYTPRLRYTGIIRDLQKYWILRGVTPGPATYTLRPHARALCERLHATLFSALVVSEVEAAFRRLREGIGEGDEGFLAWARELLPQLSLNVEQQLVALDNAIETAVVKLRHQTSQDEETFLVTLQEVDTTLVDLLQKATELSRAFGHTVALQAQLLHLWTSNDQEQTTVNQAARQALRFIDRARQRLDELSQRLSWVHPRVQALFGNLGKLRFDRKTEQFLLALLRTEPGASPADLLAGVPLAYQPLRFNPHPGRLEWRLGGRLQSDREELK